MLSLGRVGASPKRTWACASLIACALVASGLRANAARAALTWNATPLPVDPGKSLNAVSCPSATLCVAAAGAQELAFNPNRFRRPRPHTLFSGRGLQIESLWCPARTLCIAIDFQSAVSFNPTKLSRPARAMRLETISGEGLVSIRCPSRGECVAIDSYGGAITYNPLTHRIVRRRITVEGNERLTALACPSVAQCTALDDNGTEISFQPRTGARLSSLQIDTAVGLDAPSGGSDNELDALSCQNVTLCTAADTLGNIIQFDPQQAGAGGAFSMASVQYPGSSLTAISCKPSGICVTVDRNGNAIAGTGNQSWQLQRVEAGPAFNAVACPTSSKCIAVDSVGNAVRIYPTPF